MTQQTTQTSAQTTIEAVEKFSQVAASLVAKGNDNAAQATIAIAMRGLGRLVVTNENGPRAAAAYMAMLALQNGIDARAQQAA